MTTPATADARQGSDEPQPWNHWAEGVAAAAPGTPDPRIPSASPAPSPSASSPGWARWALAGLLTATAVLYLWGLSRNGWANAYYSAAAQAGAASWTAWFFGSLDAASAITVDKPPASLWLMGLSVRLFGLSSWSILVPQALLGVASVGVLHATVRRWFGPAAGLIAGVVLALTPVAVLMFRYNNPDAMLVLLLVCAAWAMGRATERGSVRWIMLAGSFVGMAFLAKMMQAFLVLPGFVAMYAVAAPIDLRRRNGHLFAALGAMLVAGGWWVAVVALWPASSRPYIGGSQTNSVVELILGYNGFGRLTGDETGSVVGGGAGTGSMWGETGWGRLFDASYGGQIAWLLPMALAMIGVLLWTSRSGARTDLTRAAAIGWGGWLLVTAAVISFGQGIIHEYYTVALAPAIGALVGIGAMTLWVQRDHLWARLTAAALVVGSASWAAVLLGRSPAFVAWLPPIVLSGGLVVATVLAVSHLVPTGPRRQVALAAWAAAAVTLLAGPTAYAMQTVSTTSSGSLPTAGPTVTGARMGPAGGPGGAIGQVPGGGQGGRPGGFLAGAPGGSAGPVPGSGRGGGPAGNAGGAGSPLEGSSPSDAVTAALLADAGSYSWVAATVGANSAAGYQLATERPVLAIGGFNGSDPAPTLAQFQADVAAGRIHYFLGTGRGSGPGGGPGGQQMGGSQAASEITAWVQSTFSATTVDGVTLYDLTSPTGATAGAVMAT